MKGKGEGVERPLRILLMGERKSGKTTCCMNAVRLLREQGLRPGGVVCPKLCDETGRIVGIEVVDILCDPPSREVLARTDRCLDGPSTGAYHFAERGLAFGREALERGAKHGDVVFADELGPLEVRGKGFSNLIELARTPSHPPMVIVVRTNMVPLVIRELEPFPVTTLPMKSSNPEETPTRLVELLKGKR